ncbi:Fc.00g063780.m01.CDS01 [Cosmosporella sp. VM-42]
MESPLSQACVDPELREEGDGATPAAEVLSRWKGKEPATSTSGERGPLTLMKLPVDILRLIFNEVASHSRGDLLGILAANSTLHNLAAPYIHSSFDIVWPDESDIFANQGVDALTHGLATFTLGSQFGRTIHKLHRHPRTGRSVFRTNYAHFTRNFCMGNGPTRWVSDYSINTESGKMLNTLVALAIQKMVNLEVFKWDMPTGLSSDVFMALASLDDQPDEHPCRLEQVWVRWHDSRFNDSSSSSSPAFVDDGPLPPPPAQPPSPPSSGPESIGSLNLNPHPSRRRVPYWENEAQYPTFSVLPPLKSLTVLDINQLAYLDELSILIERSRPALKELRLSVAAKCKDQDFIQVKGDQHNLQQVDHEARWPGESNIGGRRLGGVLGVVLGRVYDLRKNWPRQTKDETSPTELPVQTLSPDVGASTNVEMSGGLDTGLEIEELDCPDGTHVGDCSQNPSTFGDERTNSCAPKEHEEFKDPPESREGPGDKLTLERLELGRIPLHTRLCAQAFDWTVLSSLTILQCPGQEKLWRALRQQFRPTLINTRPRRGSSRQSSRETWQYHLKLKSLHVDVTTFSLMNFLKETLAPNSLEVLFLHDRRRTTTPPVPIGQVFAGPIKRQHSSLKKLLLDSTHPDKVANIGDSRRMSWALTTEMVLYVTSGRMESLRELSVSIDSSDWHTFLQRLPNIPHLTSLNFPSVGRVSAIVDSEELGLQVVDVITLRPETRLRFLGIRNVRFEIVESHHRFPGSEVGSAASDDGSSVSTWSGSHPPSSDEAVDDEEEIPPSDNDSEVESHSSRRVTSEDVSSRDPVQPEPTTTYRLREILSCDDKVAIFKARHGKL